MLDNKITFLDKDFNEIAVESKFFQSILDDSYVTKKKFQHGSAFCDSYHVIMMRLGYSMHIESRIYPPGVRSDACWYISHNIPLKKYDVDNIRYVAFDGNPEFKEQARSALDKVNTFKASAKECIIDKGDFLYLKQPVVIKEVTPEEAIMKKVAPFFVNQMPGRPLVQQEQSASGSSPVIS